MKNAILRAIRDERGYVMVLALIAMPLLLGMSLLVIDLSRANNLHTDLVNDVDALALAGARELNGGSDAITRARAVINNLIKNQARLSDEGPVIVDGDDVVALFYENIPSTDDSDSWDAPLDDDQGILARYVRVIAKTKNMTSLFPVPVGLSKDTLDVGAEAVATYRRSVCNITPLFICNPFEETGENLVEAYEAGYFHGRLIRLRPSNGSDTAGPGAFGFLAIAGAPPSAVELKKYFAQGGAPACFDASGVNLNPGNMDSVNAAINTRFDLKEPGLGGIVAYPPARNVRKGAKRPTTGNPCNNVNLSDPVKNAAEATDGVIGFPLDANYPADGFSSGAIIGDGNFDRDGYWNLAHGVLTGLPGEVISSFASLGLPPSRHDIYTYELENPTPPTSEYYKDPSPGSLPGVAPESGRAVCYMNNNSGNEPPSSVDGKDRREIYAALINCAEHNIRGAEQDIPVEAFVSIFLANPVRTVHNTPSSSTYPLNNLDIEITGITGGQGALDLSFREEVFLVR